MNAGRPRKYKTKKALETAVRAYFESISRTVAATDDDGERLFNDQGDLIRITQWVRPPTVGGLCQSLGIDRSTWQNYCSRELHPEFESVTTWAREVIQGYLEEQLLTREKGLQGVIFNLQNNYGWRQKQEVELGPQAAKQVRAAAVPLAEREALLRELAQEFTEDAGADEGGE